jgi:hypothetical protein
MKRFLTKFVLFSVPLLAVYIIIMIWILPRIIEKKMGPSTRKQIDQSFKNVLLSDFDLLILGNSRPYRGINPDLLEVSSFNFSHDNDTYNQLYYKLKFLDKNNKSFKYLVLGVDYFQFSYISATRNYAYYQWFDEEYKSDYPFHRYIPDFIYETQILDPSRIKYIKYVFDKKYNKTIYLKENGQYIRPGKATESNISDDSIFRIPVQVNYFEKILQKCRKDNIKVFLCMMPARQLALKNYTPDQIKEFDSFISGYRDNNTFLLNFTYDKSFVMSDYTDVKHLTEEGADKFTKLLNDSIKSLIRTTEVRNVKVP